jgi:putative protease
MMGVRSEGDKQTSKELVPFDKITRKIPLDMSFSMKRDEAITLSADNYGISIRGDVAEEAKTAPLDRESVLRSLSKLGSTPYELRDFHADIDDGLMLPVSKLNALRRSLTDELQKLYLPSRTLASRAQSPQYDAPKADRVTKRSAVFYNVATVTPSAKEYFDIIYTPIESYNGGTNGVMLPAVIYDSQKDMILRLLRSAKELGAEHALLGNLGHLELVQSVGLIPHGDLRLNVANSTSMATAEALGFADVVLAPELTLPKARDIGGRSAVVVYGRIPLMVTEKCVGKEISSCDACKSGKVKLVDRKNTEFPVFKDISHRSIIFNSLPTYMADREDELRRANVTMRHFIFTVESAKEVDDVISKHKKGLALGKPQRRI